MWMACHTQEEIAEVVGIHQDTVSDWVAKFTENLNSKESVKFNFQDDFEPPVYNIWFDEEEKEEENNLSQKIEPSKDCEENKARTQGENRIPISIESLSISLGKGGNFPARLMASKADLSNTASPDSLSNLIS